jgi:putative DNA primase/helicase
MSAGTDNAPAPLARARGGIAATEQFRDAIRAAGLTPPDAINDDGELHRFASDGKRGNDAGWYVLHGDGVPAGIFGDWRTGLSQTWCADAGRKLSPAEAAALRDRADADKRKREAERERRQFEARGRAARIWHAATPARADHPYLVAKGIKSTHGIRQQGDHLVVPMRDGDELHSLQFISPDGGKKFLLGGRVAGCYFSIGVPNGTLCIAEGFATAASVREATGHALAVAFNAGNLEPVAVALRAKLPDVRIIICADDDCTAGNPGMTAGANAAHSVGGLIAIPDFGADRPEGATDFNDLASHGGAEAIERALRAARAPVVSTPQPSPQNSTALGLEDRPTIELLRADSIRPEPIDWLWDGWLAAGKLHMLAGAPGTGKTTIAMALAATLSACGRWPDGSRVRRAGGILIWSGEDDPQDTLVPRLLASGADMKQIHFVGRVCVGGDTRQFDPSQDIGALNLELARRGDIRLLIVDPVVSAVAADSNKNAEVRRSLQPLVDLGASLGCAVLGISHFSKGTAGRDPVERVTGSVAFGALPRVVLATAKVPDEGDEPGGRILARAKSNIGPDTGAFRYDLEQLELESYPGVFASRVMWGAALDGSARELLAQAETDDDVAGGETPKRFLEGLLADGPLMASQIFRDADAHGYSKRQMQRASKALGVAIVKLGMNKGWQWRLPKVPLLPEDAEDASQRIVEPSAPSVVSSTVDDVEEVF